MCVYDYPLSCNYIYAADDRDLEPVSADEPEVDGTQRQVKQRLNDSIKHVKRLERANKLKRQRTELQRNIGWYNRSDCSTYAVRLHCIDPDHPTQLCYKIGYTTKDLRKYLANRYGGFQRVEKILYVFEGNRYAVMQCEKTWLVRARSTFSFKGSEYFLAPADDEVLHVIKGKGSKRPRLLA